MNCLEYQNLRSDISLIFISILYIFSYINSSKVKAFEFHFRVKFQKQYPWKTILSIFSTKEASHIYIQ